MESSTVITIEVPFNEPEFCQMLNEHKVVYKTPGGYGLAFDSFMLHLFVDILESPYALPSLASVCVAYIRRNKVRRVKITQGKKTIDIDGLSVKEVEKLLKTASRIQLSSEDED